MSRGKKTGLNPVDSVTDVKVPVRAAHIESWRDHVMPVVWFTFALLLSTPHAWQYLGADVASKGCFAAIILTIFGRDGVRHVALSLLGHGPQEPVGTENNMGKSDH
jgi:hypothetical protein